jgi:hypothetical protein
MRIVLHLHAIKEHAYEAAKAAGLIDEPLHKAMYLGLEHKMEYELDPQTGEGILLSVDGKELIDVSMADQALAHLRDTAVLASDCTATRQALAEAVRLLDWLNGAGKREWTPADKLSLEEIRKRVKE